jgi:hypothetical protein
MEYSKLIHDYLDGQLAGSEEGELFTELAQDPTLRQEFNQQVNIHTLARTDMGSITTPADATNAIFSTLGFKIPSSDFIGNGGANVSAISSFGRRLSDGFKNYFPNILTASIAAVGTALLFLLLFDNFGPENRYDQYDYAVVSSSLASQPEAYYGKDIMANAAVGIPNYDNPNAVAVNDNTYAKESEFWKQQYFALVNSIKDDLSRMFASREIYAKPDNDKVFANNELQTAFMINEPYTDLSNGFNSNDLKQQDIFAPSIYQNAMMIDSPIDESKLKIEYRNLQGYSMVNVDGVRSSGDLWVTNMALAVSYDIGDNYLIGIEIGNERFAQEFQVSTPYQIYNIKQNPTLTWYGGFLRKEFPEWGYNGILFPYAQAFFGGAIANGSSEFYEHLGPLGKAQVGFYWQASQNVSFNLGAEASWLLYQYQNNIYNTAKVGVTYGVNIGF